MFSTLVQRYTLDNGHTMCWSTFPYHGTAHDLSIYFAMKDINKVRILYNISFIITCVFERNRKKSHEKCMSLLQYHCPISTLSKRFDHSLYLISMDEETECRSLYFSMDY